MCECVRIYVHTIFLLQLAMQIARCARVCVCVYETSKYCKKLIVLYHNWLLHTRLHVTGHAFATGLEHFMLNINKLLFSFAFGMKHVEYITIFCSLSYKLASYFGCCCSPWLWLPDSLPACLSV